MEKSEPLSPDKIRSGQELIKSKIFERAKKLELSNDGLAQRGKLFLPFYFFTF